MAGPRHGPRGGSRAGARARAARPRGDSGHSRIRDVLGQEQGQAAQSSACCARPRWPRVRSPTRGGTPAEFPRRRTRACLAFGLFAFRVGFPFPGVSYSLHVLFCIVHHCLGVWRFRLVPLDAPRFCDGLRLQAALVELDFQAPPLLKRSISVGVRLAGMANERERERSDDRLLPQSTVQEE